MCDAGILVQAHRSIHHYRASGADPEEEVGAERRSRYEEAEVAQPVGLGQPKVVRKEQSTHKT